MAATGSRSLTIPAMTERQSCSRAQETALSSSAFQSRVRSVSTSPLASLVSRKSRSGRRSNSDRKASIPSKGICSTSWCISCMAANESLEELPPLSEIANNMSSCRKRLAVSPSPRPRRGPMSRDRPTVLELAEDLACSAPTCSASSRSKFAERATQPMPHPNRRAAKISQSGIDRLTIFRRS